jgi:hypothetical protein
VKKAPSHLLACGELDHGFEPSTRDDQRHPTNGKHKGEHRPLEMKDTWGKRFSPKAGEAPLPLPRGFRGRRCRTYRCRRGARRHLRSARGCFH